MKSNVMPSLVQIGENELKQLVSEVKETIATDINIRQEAKPAIFSSADLWNIRRMRRYKAGRRSAL